MAPPAASSPRSRTPWLLGNVEWTDALIKRAVLWLCEQTGKALLKLTTTTSAITTCTSCCGITAPAQKVATRLSLDDGDTIDYHPAGKEAKRVICFSPHPDDDVISMGGHADSPGRRRARGAHRLHDQRQHRGVRPRCRRDRRHGHRVQPPVRHRPGAEQAGRAAVLEALHGKHPGEPDIDAVQKIKGLIRWSEAKAGR
jgi:glucosamine-6-phosphate deaminase